jgi:F0F1-type ATP synthase assembly protein I
MPRLCVRNGAINDTAKLEPLCAGDESAPFGMNETLGRGMRLVIRVVLLQTCSGLVAALACAMQGGMRAGLSALAGGGIVAIGTILFGWRTFAPGVAGAEVLNRALMAGEALKWFWLVVSAWAALSVLKLPPAPLLVGLILAQFGYWLGLIRFK